MTIQEHKDRDNITEFELFEIKIWDAYKIANSTNIKQKERNESFLEHQDSLDAQSEN